MHNSAGDSPLEEPLREALDRAYGQELRATLPASLRPAQERGFTDYFQTATGDATAAAARRKLRTERKYRRDAPLRLKHEREHARTVRP